MSKLSRPKVLFIGRGAPWEGGAGYLVRQAMFLAALTQIADVTAAMFQLPAGTEQTGIQRGRCRRVIALPEPTRQREGKWEMLAKDCLSSTPRMFRGLKNKSQCDVIKALQAEVFDATFVYRIDSAVWAGVLNQPGLLLDIDDPEHARLIRQAEAMGKSLDMRSRIDIAKLKRFELSAARQVQLAFVCQSHDAARFEHPKPEIAPNAVPVPSACPPYAPDPDTLLFVGNLDTSTTNSPNAEGLLWFTERIWPIIRNERPNVTLRVAGKTSDAISSILRGVPSLDLLGFVDDLDQTVRSASVSLAPIRYGTGTRIKVLDALAQGIAVVSTTLGCEGLNVRNNVEVLLADDPTKFAHACLQLLADPGTAARLGRAGYELIQQEYSFKAQVPCLANRLLTLITAAQH